MYTIHGNNLIINNNNITCSNIIVLIYLKRVPKMIEAVMFLYINRITFVMIDPEEPVERTKYKLRNLKDSKKTVYILTSKEFKKNFNNEHIITIDDIDNINELHNYLYHSNCSSEDNDIAYILYTSGSTGMPKGVEITYKGLNNFIESISTYLGFLPDKKIICLTSVSFDIFFLESIAALTKKLTVILLDEQEQKNPRKLSEIILSNNIDFIQMTPSYLQLLLNYDKNIICLANVKNILIGGEIFPLKLLKILQKKTSGNIYNMYGPTETTIWSTISDLTNKNTVDIGHPINNTKVYILDENLECIPSGCVGEICISGDGLAKGYFNNPQLTNEKFVYKQERLYRTGDYGRYIGNGTFEYVGRMDNQVKIRGYRIELEEIEMALAEHPDIVQAVVIYKNYNNKNFLAAFYKSTNNISCDQIRLYLLNKIPQYMIPAKFISVKNFYYKLNGKMDKQKIWETYINENNCESKINDFTKRSILEIIKKIETIPYTFPLSENTDLLELGVDSVDFMSIVLEIENQFGIEFEPEKLLFSEFNKLEDLINYVNKKIKENI